MFTHSFKLADALQHNRIPPVHLWLLSFVEPPQYFQWFPINVRRHQHLWWFMSSRSGDKNWSKKTPIICNLRRPMGGNNTTENNRDSRNVLLTSIEFFLWEANAARTPGEAMTYEKQTVQNEWHSGRRQEQTQLVEASLWSFMGRKDALSHGKRQFWSVFPEIRTLLLKIIHRP